MAASLITNHSAYFETENLIVRSITESDLPFYKTLFGHPVVMKLYQNGTPWDEKKIENRVEGWINRWKTGDVYSALVVIHKKDQTPIGHFVLGHGCKIGEADVAGLGLPEYQNRKYGQEVATAIFSRYLPELKKFPVNIKDTDAPEGPLTELHATANQQNAASKRLLEKYGFELKTIGDENGISRGNYYKKV